MRNPITSVVDWAKRAAQQPLRFPMYGFSGFGGDRAWAWMARLLPGSRRDFAAEAGDLWLNSIVMICHKWQSRIFPEAPFVVYKKSADGAQDEAEIVPNHPLTLLIETPNPYYDGTVLWAATLLSLLVAGNAFWFIERSASGEPVRLWWVPHWMVRPMWDPDTPQFISGYKYHVNGQYYDYGPNDFLHFRDGIDPRDERMGLGCLLAECRHIVTDNEWATYSAAISRNMGVPGVVIMPPKGATPAQGKPVQIGLPTVDLIKNTWREKFTKDKAGLPLVLDMPLEVTPIGFSPKELDVKIMRALPEERIAAATGIPAVVLGLGAGLAQASAKASHEDSQRQAYYGNIIPNQRILGRAVNRALLPELGDPDTEFCGFDTSQVLFLRPNFNAAVSSAVEAFAGGLIKLNEGRKRIGEKPDPKNDGYAWQLGAVTGGAGGKPAKPVEPDADEPDKPTTPKPGEDSHEGEDK